MIVNVNVHGSLVIHSGQLIFVRLVVNQKMDVTMHPSMLFVVMVHILAYIELNQIVAYVPLPPKEDNAILKNKNN